MWIVVTLIGGVVGIVIEILLTPIEDSGIQKACVIAKFFIGIAVTVFCLYSPMNMKNFSKVYPICTIFIPKDNKDECSTTKKCENCGAENSLDAKYCEECGEKFEITQE